MSYGNRWGREGPPEEAYSRVTDAERFRPLHAAMREIIARLQSEYDVTLDEGYGLDEELERHMNPAAPTVRLSPSDGDAAPITIVFSDFPGLHVRFGRWLREPFPGCGCDACDESAEVEIERLIDIIDDVTAGRFREGIRVPVQSGSGWRERERWADETRLQERNTGVWSRGESRIDRQRALELTGGARRLNLNWKPWPADNPTARPKSLPHINRLTPLKRNAGMSVQGAGALRPAGSTAPPVQVNQLQRSSSQYCWLVLPRSCS